MGHSFVYLPVAFAAFFEPRPKYKHGMEYDVEDS